MKPIKNLCDAMRAALLALAPYEDWNDGAQTDEFLDRIAVAGGPIEQMLTDLAKNAETYCDQKGRK